MKNKYMLKISLLSVSLLMGTAAAINGNIPALADEFINIPLSLVEMISTLPSLFLMISVLISTTIAKKIGYKRTIAIGIALVAVAGFIPVVVNNFYIVLVSRAVFGFGIGLFNSLVVALVNYFYDDEQRSKMFGFQSAFEGMGGLAVTFISGQLLNISWNASFLAYMIAFPILVLFITFVPKVSTDKITEKNKSQIFQERQNTKEDLPLMVLGYVGAIFFIAIFFMLSGIKVAGVMQAVGYGETSSGSFVIMMIGIGGMIGGFLFSKVLRFCKEYTITLGLSLLTIAMYIIAIATSILPTLFAGILIGIAFRFILPYFIDKMNNSQLSNPGLATSLLLVGYNLGIAISPYGAIFLETICIFRGPSSIFYMNAIVFLIMTCISFFVMLVFHSQKCA